MLHFKHPVFWLTVDLLGTLCWLFFIAADLAPWYYGLIGALLCFAGAVLNLITILGRGKCNGVSPVTE